MNMKAIRNCLSAAILASLLGVITLPVLITPSAAQGPSVPSYYRPAPGPPCRSRHSGSCRRRWSVLGCKASPT